METIILIALIVLFFIWRMRPVKGVTTISTEQLKAMKNDSSKVFIDVRTPAEFKARHVKPFVNMPLGSDFSKLPRDKEIVVICQSGMRSKQACNQLKKMGYSNMINVRGGMSAY
ncbi:MULTISPECIES: rhodanese-like domain-containing protein [Paenibacillus]|uniref:rhodanese-like domain-containing protein n=1 Tax=Paenibacillus TaxID=44249 RepID=UPI00203C19A9|nr:rhodanese-like domain-containing protein [Paenibacillus camelliae]MCM3631846.1 rhodanese-like domain-containing protein [Paenibacillus camelliae]